MATTAVEKSKIRSDVVRRARMGPFSMLTALVGTLVGGISLAVLVAGTQTLLRRNESNIDLSRAWDQAWNEVGRRGALGLAVLLFLSYLLAAFVAGRMAWRRGWLHGLTAELDLREQAVRNEASDERLAPIDRDERGNGKLRLKRETRTLQRQR